MFSGRLTKCRSISERCRVCSGWNVLLRLLGLLGVSYYKNVNRNLYIVDQINEIKNIKTCLYRHKHTKENNEELHV